MVSWPCLVLQVGSDIFPGDCGKCQAVEVAGPKRKEKGLIERTFSHTQKRRGRPVSQEWKGQAHQFPGRARLNGDLSDSNYILLKFFLPQRRKKWPPGGTESSTCICQVYLQHVLRIVDKDLNPMTQGSQDSREVLTGNEQKYPPQGTQVQAQVQVSHPRPPVITYAIFFFILFYWSIVDLQCCISFRCTAK